MYIKQFQGIRNPLARLVCCSHSLNYLPSCKLSSDFKPDIDSAVEVYTSQDNPKEHFTSVLNGTAVATIPWLETRYRKSQVP